jgi:ribosomal protein S18 acetylase RimI-like enzyme
MLEIGKKRIGFYSIEERKDHLYISRIYLTESYRKKGMGSYLIKMFEKQTKKKRILLEVWKGNPAKEFYQSLGFKAVGMKEHRYLMEKRL